EAVVDRESGALPDELVEMLAWMDIPLIRYPGGTDVDRLDWTDRVDGAYGRQNQTRPISITSQGKISNHFGYDEFLELAETLDTEPLIVVNFRDALLDTPGMQAPEIKAPGLKAAAEHAAALVAYCNARADGDLPPRLQRWADLRARNGRHPPWGVKYWQIGNETFTYLPELIGHSGSADPKVQARWLIDRVVTIAHAMREVDPSIVVLFDQRFGLPQLTPLVVEDPGFRGAVDFQAVHLYAPGGVRQLFRGDREIVAADQPDQTLWYAYVGMPGHFEEDRVLAMPDNTPALANGRRVAVTEWNWVGFGPMGMEDPGLRAMAQALGSANLLHGMIRQGDRIALATQSMLVGTSWKIAAIHVDVNGHRPPYFSASGLVAGLYSREHGASRLAVRATSPQPAVVQDMRVVGWGVHTAANPLPWVDLVATRNEETLYLHVIQRSFSQAQRVSVDVSALIDGDATAEVYHVEPRPDDDPGVDRDDAARLRHAVAPVLGGRVDLDLPARSVTVVKLSIPPSP
ncbi:MAG: hypothetical protein AAFX76_07505, partial [Planctomycetota bacterium]